MAAGIDSKFHQDYNKKKTKIKYDDRHSLKGKFSMQRTFYNTVRPNSI